MPFSTMTGQASRAITPCRLAPMLAKQSAGIALNTEVHCKGWWHIVVRDTPAGVARRMRGLHSRMIARTPAESSTLCSELVWVTMRWHFGHREYVLVLAQPIVSIDAEGPANAVDINTCAGANWEPARSPSVLRPSRQVRAVLFSHYDRIQWQGSVYRMLFFMCGDSFVDSGADDLVNCSLSPSPSRGHDRCHKCNYRNPSRCKGYPPINSFPHCQFPV